MKLFIFLRFFNDRESQNIIPIRKVQSFLMKDFHELLPHMKKEPKLDVNMPGLLPFP